MSQATDYVLANQSGANFRSELNSVLAAVSSTNSGSTAPTTAYAYMMWVDTGVSPALLKLRNGANNAWITLGDVTVTNLGLATLASPTLTGTPLSTTAAVDTNTTQIATTAYVLAQASASTPVIDGTATIGTSTRFARADHIHPTDTSRAALATAQTFTAQQRGTISALTDGATITADFALANNFSVTLGGSRTLANPSNLTAGASGCIWITQDGTGSRTLAYGSQWDFTGGTAPTLTTTAAAVDCLVYSVQSSSKITATLITNLS
jgi:hypothetical protein